MILTQQKFQAHLKAEGLPMTTSSVHLCIEAGMPVVRVPGKKKPRFYWPDCWAWIIASRELDTLVVATRDRMFKRMRRAG